MEKALAATGGGPVKTAVTREGGRVLIENVPLPRGLNSVLACLAAALQANGEDVTYEYLMGISSRAFRLQVSWCPSAPHSHCGFNTFEPALRAAGYDRDEEQMLYIGAEKPGWAGISGLNIDTCGDPKVGKLEFWDSCVRGAIRPGFLGGWWSDVAFVLGQKRRDVSVRDRTLATLGLATHMFRPGKLAAVPYFGVTYYFGERAYEQWAGDLRELDYPADAEKLRPKAPEIYDLSATVCQVQQIVGGRSAAARFCNWSATVLPEVADELAAAARAYREEVAMAEQTFAPFLPGDEKPWQAWPAR